MGLNRSLSPQFGSYISGLAHGSLGTSYTTSNPVAQDLLTRLPATVELAVASTVLATIVGVPLGIMAGLHKGRPSDWSAASRRSSAPASRCTGSGLCC
jgi:ABC-type dipeptide/oligopeptide/nickel transport system permease component